MPKGYWIGHVDVTDDAEYLKYVARNNEILPRFGAKFLVRAGQFEAPETPQRSRHVVVEFPDLKTALACYYSDDYQANLLVRRAASDGDVVIVEGN